MLQKSAPTTLRRVYVEVRTPYDGIIIEGMINKLARKNLAQFHQATIVRDLPSEDERGFGKAGSDLVPDRVVIDLDTEKMSELKTILDDLQNAKEKNPRVYSRKRCRNKEKIVSIKTDSHVPYSY